MLYYSLSVRIHFFTTINCQYIFGKAVRSGEVQNCAGMLCDNCHAEPNSQLRRILLDQTFTQKGSKENLWKDLFLNVLNIWWLILFRQLKVAP